MHNWINSGSKAPINKTTSGGARNRESSTVYTRMTCIDSSYKYCEWWQCWNLVLSLKEKPQQIQPGLGVGVYCCVGYIHTFNVQLQNTMNKAINFREKKQKRARYKLSLLRRTYLRALKRDWLEWLECWLKWLKYIIMICLLFWVYSRDPNSWLTN